MEILRRLFERHFRSPVERVEPLQGQLGGSGRKIIRLASQKVTAIGILYNVREENVAFLEFSRLCLSEIRKGLSGRKLYFFPNSIHAHSSGRTSRQPAFACPLTP